LLFLLFPHVQKKLKTQQLLLIVQLKKQHVQLKKLHVQLIVLLVQLVVQPMQQHVLLMMRLAQLLTQLPSKLSLFSIEKCIRKAI